MRSGAGTVTDGRGDAVIFKFLQEVFHIVQAVHNRAVHHAVFADAPGQAAGVDAAQADNTVLL